jgi:hypothetical protein
MPPKRKAAASRKAATLAARQKTAEPNVEPDVGLSAGAQHTEADHIAIGATMAQGIQNDIDEPAIAAALC